METSRFAFMVSSNTDALEPDKNAKVFIHDKDNKPVASTAYVDGDNYDYKIFNNQDGVYYANLPAGIYSVYTGAASNKVAQKGLQNIEHTGGKAVTHINDEQSEAHASDKISHSGSTVKAKLDSLDSSKAEIDDTKEDDSHAWSGEKINSELSSKADTDTDTAAGISISDSGNYTDKENVEDALQEIYEDKETIEDNIGDRNVASTEYLSSLSNTDLTSLVTKLDLELSKLASSGAGLADGVIARVVYMESEKGGANSTPSAFTEYYKSSDTHETRIIFPYRRKSNDKYLRLTCEGKAGSSQPTQMLYGARLHIDSESENSNDAGIPGDATTFTQASTLWDIRNVCTVGNLYKVEIQVQSSAYLDTTCYFRKFLVEAING